MRVVFSQYSVFNEKSLLQTPRAVKSNNFRYTTLPPIEVIHVILFNILIKIS